MLTRKQLEDVTMCPDIECEKCSANVICEGGGYINAKAAQTALAYREMLERLEFTRDGCCITCPVCGGTKSLGHAAGCELAALLNDKEG
jgi:hypothetical protein